MTDPLRSNHGMTMDDVRHILFLLILCFFSFFSGFKNKDVAFLHVESKALIEADLLFNLPAKEQVILVFSLSVNTIICCQYSKSSSTPNFPFINGLSPTSWFHPRMIWGLGVDKQCVT